MTIANLAIFSGQPKLKAETKMDVKEKKMDNTGLERRIDEPHRRCG